MAAVPFPPRQLAPQAGNGGGDDAWAMKRETATHHKPATTHPPIMWGVAPCICSPTMRGLGVGLKAFARRWCCFVQRVPKLQEHGMMSWKWQMHTAEGYGPGSAPYQSIYTHPSS